MKSRFAGLGLLYGWLLGALLIAACARPQPPPTTLVPGASRAVIIDTDMGADDIMAILYLLQRPDVQVRAIPERYKLLHHWQGTSSGSS